jgi:DNA ligase (NAD+)
MNKDKIIKDYKTKIRELIINNKYYYEDNKPRIDDQEYDKLKNKILLLEKEYPFLRDSNSPSLKVGHKPSKNFKKVTHKVPMLSLGNAFSENDLNNFEKKILNYINDFKFEDIEYSAEPKIDGISASLIYKDGIFIKGLSRGDGKEGENITEKLKNNKRYPAKNFI